MSGTTPAPLNQALSWAQWWPSVRAGLWVVALFGAGVLLVRLYATPIRQALDENFALGIAVFVATSAVAVLLPVLTNLPLVPVATLAFGPWWTAALLLGGWALGSALSFVLARRARTLILRRLPSVQRHADIERLIDPRHRVASLALLRATFPVDVLSYALGLFSPATTLAQNTLATLLGAAPFALLFAFVPALSPAGQAAVLGVSLAGFLAYLAWVLRRPQRA
jgi:uncharacterized membrane protein YdjX (TVP38/TMEM64 family)